MDKKFYTSSTLAIGALLLLATFSIKSSNVEIGSQNIATALGSNSSGNTLTDVPVSAGLTSNSPFYLLDILTEKIDLALTVDPEKRVNILLRNAKERLEEARVLRGGGKVVLAYETLAASKENIQLINYEIVNIPDIDTKENFESKSMSLSLQAASLETQQVTSSSREGPQTETYNVNCMNGMVLLTGSGTRANPQTVSVDLTTDCDSSGASSTSKCTTNCF